MHYILDENREPKEVDVYEVMEWFETGPTRTVKQEYGTSPDGYRYLISTIFLGLNHNFAEEGPPELFETMVFPVDDEGNTDYLEAECLRCATWDEAENTHESVISRWGFTNLEEKAE